MKLEDRLPTALDNIANTPPVPDAGEFDPHQTVTAHPLQEQRGSKRLLAAAAAVAAIGVGGLVIASNQSTPDPVADSQPVAQPPAPTFPPVTAPAPGPDGALLLPPTASLRPMSIEQGALAGTAPVAWYGTPVSRPETGTYLRVQAVDLGPAPDNVPQCVSDRTTATATLADGATACLEQRDASADPTGIIERRLGGYVVIIDGNASDDQLIAAAENLTPGPSAGSFTIEAAGLPEGLELIATGFGVSDFAYVADTDANDDDMISTIYVDDQSKSIFYLATRSDPDSLAIHRLGFASVADKTVRGQPGIFRTLENEPSYLGLVWHENGFTYQLGSQHLTQPELLDIVDQLTVATQADWDTATASVPDVDQMETEPASTTIVIDE
ncbi:hypothetical protein [Ilumatobacter nonamiensis]|uniref:hypothetical protein n=1 Tax=Ilumatobacter nonamiensis TaxID=467093 RepID=UPI00034D8BA6|nr:hypothetical protein [Ilumatobacter nonamiensis]